MSISELTYQYGIQGNVTTLRATTDNASGTRCASTRQVLKFGDASAVRLQSAFIELVSTLVGESVPHRLYLSDANVLYTSTRHCERSDVR